MLGWNSWGTELGEPKNRRSDENVGDLEGGGLYGRKKNAKWGGKKGPKKKY